MLFRLNKPVDVDNPQDSITKKVSDEIQEIKNTYFNKENTMGFVTLVYPRGEPDFGNAEYRAVWGVLKKFPIETKSIDNVWRWSGGAPYVDDRGKMIYKEPAVFVMHRTIIEEDRADWLWFLLNHSSAMKSGRVYLEDLEAEAKEENEEFALDADIRSDIFGKRSPIAKDHALIKNIADTFGVLEIEKKGIEVIKNELYNMLLEGEQRGDRFVNFDKFEELTDGSTKRKAGQEARNCLRDGIVKFKDKAWFLMDGYDYAELLTKVKPADIPFKEEVFVEEMINNKNVRARVYDSLGIEDFINAEDLRELDRNTLMRKAKDLGLETKSNDTKEALIEKICEKNGVEYKQP